MDSKELRAKQAPLKKKYLKEPGAAQTILHAEGSIGTNLGCRVETDNGMVEAGLHPFTGGDGSQACSGDMLLQALVGCAGVTLNTVATAMGITLKDATVRAEGSLDFRGTLGVSKEAAVGFENIKLIFKLDTDAPQESIDKLIELTERYCVVYQTLQQSPEIVTEVRT
ncbi:OsmC family protein [Halalkalibaculum sp. DA3122]|uniref:OsmC family protein n=1 Tax=unclassified Halalkalibaculum TaxID=2964617 RepID=UPI003754F1DC